MKNLTIVMAQQNALVGAVERNAEKILATIHAHPHADLIVFPELALTGYPPEDWLFRKEFQKRVIQTLEKLCQAIGDVYAAIGHPRWEGENCFNSVSIIHHGKIILSYDKQCLPNYGVFDERRYFTEGNKTGIFELKGTKIGVLICEDLWHPGPWGKTVKAGAECLILLNASPFNRNKYNERKKILHFRQETEGNVPIVYVNRVGGQDELVFDGQSFVMNAEGEIVTKLPAFEESSFTFTLAAGNALSSSKEGTVCFPFEKEALVYQALVCGTRDYVQKNGFSDVLIGLSGGIDSALTLAIAVDALGQDHVTAVFMPSRYTAVISGEEAQAQAKLLGVEYHEISIEEIFEAFLKNLNPLLSSFSADITEENIQSRCRGILLMALSNKMRKLVLTTGNKSELAMGYCTLYGDMAGGLDVLKDVTKTWVYRLAHYRNQQAIVIPERIIDRPPSAELSFNQKDEDSLPPYAVLDEIIERYVEANQSPEQIIASGIPEETVLRVIKAIHQNEYKRRQAPPGIKVTGSAFGRDWRYPMTSIRY